MVKCEKWACSTLEAGKNKPSMYITKTRDFKRFSKEIKETGGSIEPPILALHTLLREHRPRKRFSAEG